jgi:hypothetical protein
MCSNNKLIEIQGIINVTISKKQTEIFDVKNYSLIATRDKKGEKEK